MPARSIDAAAEAAAGESLGGTLRAARHAAGLTLRELALASRLSVSYLSQIERDLLVPSVSALRRVAGIVDIPAGALAFAAGARRGRSSVTVVRRDARKRVRFGDKREDLYLVGVPDFANQQVNVVAVEAGATPSEAEALTDPANRRTGRLDVVPGDTVQIVIVTIVALASLLVLLRPLFAGRKAAAAAGADDSGCSGCAAREQGPANGPGA